MTGRVTPVDVLERYIKVRNNYLHNKPIINIMTSRADVKTKLTQYNPNMPFLFTKYISLRRGQNNVY